VANGCGKRIPHYLFVVANGYLYSTALFSSLYIGTSLPHCYIIKTFDIVTLGPI
jgi:hypothetical protein